MNYKISGAIRRTRKYYIIFAILWVFISIVLVMPLTIGFHEAQIQHNISKGFEVIIDSIQHLGKSFGILSSQKIWGDYLKNVGLFTIFYAILMTIGLIRSAPKMNIQIWNMDQVIGAEMVNNILYLIIKRE